jgi:hypothetical protein
MSPADVEDFYGGFANATLWPILHYRLDLADFDRRFEHAYKTVNERMAERLLPMIEPGDLVWVQDYHFLLFGQELRNRGWGLAAQMNDQLADPLYFENVEEIARTAEIVAGQPDVEYVSVFTTEGRVLVDTSLPGFEALGSAASETGLQVLSDGIGIEEITEGVLEITQPVMIEQQIVGGVQIGLRVLRPYPKIYERFDYRRPSKMRSNSSHGLYSSKVDSCTEPP